MRLSELSDRDGLEFAAWQLNILLRCLLDSQEDRHVIVDILLEGLCPLCLGDRLPCDCDKCSDE